MNTILKDNLMHALYLASRWQGEHDERLFGKGYKSTFVTALEENIKKNQSGDPLIIKGESVYTPSRVRVKINWPNSFYDGFTGDFVGGKESLASVKLDGYEDVFTYIPVDKILFL